MKLHPKLTAVLLLYIFLIFFEYLLVYVYSLKKEMMEVLMQWSSEGKLNPYISSVVPLQEARRALTLIANRYQKEIF